MLFLTPLISKLNLKKNEHRIGDKIMNEGWVCPRCNKVNAPDVRECCCSAEIPPYPEPERTTYIPHPIYPTQPHRPILYDWYTIY